MKNLLHSPALYIAIVVITRLFLSMLFNLVAVGGTEPEIRA